MSGSAASPQEIVERALALSTCDGCVVVVDDARSVNLRWANNTLTTNGAMRSRSVTVIATVGTATGVAAGTVERSAVAAADLEGLVREAEAAARAAGDADDAGPLVEPSGDDPDWSTPAAETGPAALAAVAPTLGETMCGAQAAGRLLFGFAEHTVVTSYLGTSTGLRRRWAQPTAHLEINAKSRDLTRSAWAARAGEDFADVDVAAMDADLATRLGWARRRVDLPAGRYETVLPPSATADLMVYLYWSSAGRDAAEGATVFSRSGGGTRVGERLSPLPLSLRSDPAAAGLASQPFVQAATSSAVSSVFDNGLPLGPTDWIADGTLAALLETRHTAATRGVPVTPYIDNLSLTLPGASATEADLVAGTGHGLLLTCLWYIREVDPQTLLLTGLTRDGVYLVEGGEVVAAVNNFRFNESPVDLLGRISEVGATVRTAPREWLDDFTRAAMPPVRVPDFHMSTVSQAT